MLTTLYTKERHDLCSATIRLSMFIDLVESHLIEKLENGPAILESAREAMQIVSEAVATRMGETDLEPSHSLGFQADQMSSQRDRDTEPYKT